MAGMIVHSLRAQVLMFVFAVSGLALAWFRWRQGKTYWLTIAWWMAVAWALWTTAFLMHAF
jgi:hypothetical protein